MLKIATWNVNSIRTRLHAVDQWFSDYQPDVVAFQEIKVMDDSFPYDWFAERGYHVAVHGQKSYNGVATVSRTNITQPITSWEHWPDDQARFLQVTLPNDLIVINVYVPNGQSLDSPKYTYKLQWLDALLAHLSTIDMSKNRVVLMGDFNIAPTDQDVHDPEIWQDKILVSPEERSRYQSICALGMVDTYRMIHPDSPGFSWWDYRQAGWRRDRGLRIDCVFVSEHLRPACQTADVHRLTRGGDRPSDHAPVTIELIND